MEKISYHRIAPRGTEPAAPARQRLRDVVDYLRIIAPVVGGAIAIIAVLALVYLLGIELGAYGPVSA